MDDLQSIAFREAQVWPSTTGLLVLVIGLLFTLQGFRFARFLLAGSVAAVGFVLGAVGSEMADLPPLVGAWSGAGILGVVALARFRLGVYLSSIITFCVLGFFLATRAQLSPDGRVIAATIGLVVGACAPYALGRAAPIMLTSIQGGMLMIVGFVGAASGLAPSLASTFVDWTQEIGFMSPLLLTMAIITGYSVQSNMQQGDISTGGTFGDLHQEES